MKSRFYLQVIILTILVSCTSQEKPGSDQMSASFKRFKESGLRNEHHNEFYSRIKTSEVTGIGFEEGVARRDPTGVIKVGDLYHVWYTRPPAGIPVVGQPNANDTLRAYHWDLADIWHATSPDGINWTEQGPAATRGPKGNFDARSVFTPDVLVANGKYYLFYQAAGSLEQGKGRGDFRKNVIGMSWADSPDGPWTRWPEPLLQAGNDIDWDANVVHDPTLIVRNGKYWLYYKSVPNRPDRLPPGETVSVKYRDLTRGWGVAIADKPEGPYIKSELNPVLVGGHETIFWPYRKGVCSMMIQGPERGSVQFAEDGLNFYPRAHGLEVPEAAGVFRVGHFTDTDEQPGQGITWGLFHKLGEWNYLMRFDCDLSIQTGDKKNQAYKELMEWTKD